jgi:hypothetical protein
MNLNNLTYIRPFQTLRLVYLYSFRVNCTPRRVSRGVMSLLITFLILLVYSVY